MNEAEFDRFADEYEIGHRLNIAVTGETPEFFAAYKILNFAPDLLTAPARILATFRRKIDVLGRVVKGRTCNARPRRGRPAGLFRA
jgi:hypothetical protein